MDWRCHGDASHVRGAAIILAPQLVPWIFDSWGGWANGFRDLGNNGKFTGEHKGTWCLYPKSGFFFRSQPRQLPKSCYVSANFPWLNASSNFVQLLQDPETCVCFFNLCNIFHDSSRIHPQIVPFRHSPTCPVKIPQSFGNQHLKLVNYDRIDVSALSIQYIDIPPLIIDI